MVSPCRCSRVTLLFWASFWRRFSGPACYTPSWELLIPRWRRGLIGDGSWPRSLLSALSLVSWSQGMNEFPLCNTCPSPCAPGLKRPASPTRKTKEVQKYELLFVIVLVLGPGQVDSPPRRRSFGQPAVTVGRLSAAGQTDHCRYRTQTAGGEGLRRALPTELRGLPRSGWKRQHRARIGESRLPRDCQ